MKTCFITQFKCIQMPKSPPPLLTTGRMADILGVKPDRIRYILATRRDIQPSAYAAHVRLYDLAAMARVRHELAAIDARRGRPRSAAETAKRLASDPRVVVASDMLEGQADA